VPPDYLSVVKNDFLTLESISKKASDKGKNGNNRGPFGTITEQLYQRVCFNKLNLIYYCS
jgi:hypothetical protein